MCKKSFFLILHQVVLFLIYLIKTFWSLSTQDELQKARWLQGYGEILSVISEKSHKDSDHLNPFGNGTCVVRMKLKKKFPQYLPIYERKLRIYYPGSIMNRMTCLHGKIDYRWFRKSFGTYKIEHFWLEKWL